MKDTFVAQEMFSIPSSSNTVEKVLADEENIAKSSTENTCVKQDAANMPKSPNLGEKSPTKIRVVKHDEINMPKSPYLGVKTPTENEIYRQDEIRKPKSPNLCLRTPMENKTAGQDVAKIPKSPNIRLKAPTDNNIVGQDEVRKQKPSNLRLKVPTENNYVTHDGVRIPRSPKSPSRMPRENQNVTNDGVRLPRSPKSPSRMPRENQNVTHDGVRLPRSPKSPGRMSRENQNVTHDGVRLPRSPKSPSRMPRENQNVSHDGVRIPRSPRSPARLGMESKYVTQDGVRIPRSPRLPVRMSTEMKSVAENDSTDDLPEKAKKEAEVDQDPWTFKKICITFAMGTSNHGFANVNRLWLAGYKHSSMALLAISLFMPLTGFLVGFIGVRDILQPNYFSTQITLISDKETGLALPKIIVSNSGLFNYSALQEFNVSRYEASLMTTLLLGDVAHTSTLDNNIEKANKDYHALLARLNTTAWGVWSILSYKCHEVIIDCLFNGKRIPGPTCCKEHFETAIVSSGLSYVSKTKFVQEREEIPSGITLNLRVPIHPLDLDWDYMRGDALLLKSGLRVSILDSNKDYSGGISSTTPVLGNDRILVSLSYDQHDNTGLYQSLFPWFDAKADCTPEDAPFRELAAVGDNCMGSSLHVCGQKLRNCNIVSFPFWNEKERFCDFRDQVAMSHSRAVAECRSDHVAHCGNLCQENVYRFSVQTCPLLEFNDKGNNSKWAVEGAFTMFYTHLSHNLVKKSKTNFVDVLCTLGGTMNNFMGASVLNLGEEATVLAGIIIYTLVTIRRKVSAFKKKETVIAA